MEGKIKVESFLVDDGGLAEISDGVLRLHFERGEYPEAKFPIKDSRQFNSVSFDIKTKNTTGVATILYAGGRRAISDVANFIGSREFPQNEWRRVTWYFRQAPGWVTPPSRSAFLFDEITHFGLAVNGKNEGAEYSIKNIVFSDADVPPVDTSRFDSFYESWQEGTLRGKKALLWAGGMGKNSCTVQSVADKFSYYEGLKDYDGLIMECEALPNVAFRDTIFTREPLAEELLQESVRAYKAMDWKHFKENFIRLDIVGASRFKNADGSNGVLDWFDDDLFYNHIYPKLSRFASALKEMGVSLLFDNEAYTTEPYDYYYKYRTSGKSFADYEKIVRKRGKEFAETFAKAYPKANVLTTYGSWVVVLPKEEDRYGLLPAFMDGMCEANTALRIMDGYERGYGFATEKSIVKGAYDCTVGMRERSALSEAEANRLGYGLATWLRTDFLTKEEFAEILVGALRATQEYVWIYTESSPIEGEDVQSYHAFAGEYLRAARSYKE